MLKQSVTTTRTAYPSSFEAVAPYCALNNKGVATVKAG